MGRQKNGPRKKQPRNRMIPVRANDAEMALFKEASQIKGKPISTLFREYAIEIVRSAGEPGPLNRGQGSR